MLLKTVTKIDTRALTVPVLSDNIQERLDLVWKLSKDGMTPTEISNLFNKHKVAKKYSSKPYTPKIIGMMKLKYRNRLQRIKEKSVEIGDWEVQFVITDKTDDCVMKILKRLKLSKKNHKSYM